MEKRDQFLTRGVMGDLTRSANQVLDWRCSAASWKQHRGEGSKKGNETGRGEKKKKIVSKGGGDGAREGSGGGSGTSLTNAD